MSISLSFPDSSTYPTGRNILENVDLLASILTCLTIHIGSKARVDLPVSISSIPVTLHTLSVSWAGMYFGPSSATLGTTLYAFFWFLAHLNDANRANSSATDDDKHANAETRSSDSGAGKKNGCWSWGMKRFQRALPLSTGYILGMIPCAAVAGATVKLTQTDRNGYSNNNSRSKGILATDVTFGLHPVAAAAIGQMVTLLMGSIWVTLSQIRATGENGTGTGGPSEHFKGRKRDGVSRGFQLVHLWKRNMLPFMPGLVMKSILSWILVEMAQIVNPR